MGMNQEEKTVKAIAEEFYNLPEKVFFVKTDKLPLSKIKEYGFWQIYFDGKVIFYNKLELI
jgi:hypothetical protein